MEPVLRYRGRLVSTADVAFIRGFVADNPGANRRAIATGCCQAWNWVQANGQLRDGVCRGLLAVLERAGQIKLPPPLTAPPSRRSRRAPDVPVGVPTTPLVARLSDIGPVQIRQVRRGPEEGLVQALIAHHHYLGYVQPVGEHLKYLVTAQGRPIGCFCWSSAPRHLGPRDRHIGWLPEVRQANLRFVAYQSRFLILPWVRVPHLASHLLGRMSAQLSADWQRIYAHPIYFTETFVDPLRYRATCYRAANWSCLGMTTGRGKDCPTKRPNRSLKQVFGYPLVKDFRRRLCSVG